MNIEEYRIESRGIRSRIRASTMQLKYNFAYIIASEDHEEVLSILLGEEFAPIDGLPHFRARSLGTPGGLLGKVEWQWEESSFMPRHYHRSNETILCISGRARIYTDDFETVLEKGQSVTIPAGVSHAGFAYQDTVIITTFVPPLQAV